MKNWQNLYWVFFLILLILGILNFIFIHPFPAIIYLFIALIYLPQTDKQIKRVLNLKLRPAFKITLFAIIMLGTLGMSELFELIGSWIKFQ